jgi:hypothetical protein
MIVFRTRAVGFGETPRGNCFGPETFLLLRMVRIWFTNAHQFS